MTVTSAATGLTVQQWEDQFFTQYLHDGGFKSLMGTSEASVIQVKEDLTKDQGDSITIALVNRLTNAAVTGVSTLEGSEEAMKSRSQRIYVDKRRNAVLVPEMSQQKSAISLRMAAKPALLDWMMEDTRGLVIKALGSINGDISFTASTEAQRDAYLVDNADRVVFGQSAGSATDMSAGLDLLDTSADLLTTATIDAARYKALTASPKIRPVRDPGNGRRYFVAFAHPGAFADLRASMTTTLAATATVLEGSKLFEGGDLHWNGVIVKECDDLPVYLNLGASATTEVTPVYLCGAQALAIAFAKRPKSVTEVFDYQDKHGVAIECIYGVRKVQFGSGAGDTDDLKDHGVVTIFVATTATGNTVGIAAS
jgi:N4-gp56 family major capsid protein